MGAMIESRAEMPESTKMSAPIGRSLRSLLFVVEPFPG